MRTATGPDGVSYRIDTYIRTEPISTYIAGAAPGARDVKRVTVVIRKASTLKALARVTSTFDLSTG